MPERQSRSLGAMESNRTDLKRSDWERVPLPEAEVAFVKHWLDDAEAASLFECLLDQIPWEVHRLRLFGREIDAPRRSCWIGDPGTGYTYSRTRFEPHRWPQALMPIRSRLEQACGARFNSVLANRYRDGRDSMGWHSDDERELGPEPVIASLSLGATRRFVLRHRTRPELRHEIALPSGSLLVMRGATQSHWKHALPRTARPVGERINLTFRRIL
jgi:alkylated DNA repair dioxygenase AlkB